MVEQQEKEGGSRATFLAVDKETYKMEIEAIYSRIQEPNNETYHSGMVSKKHKQKTWCNQCMCETRMKGELKEMEGGNGTPTTRSWSWLGSSYGMENYEVKNVANGTCEAHKEYELKNVEGKQVEYDEGLEVKNDMVGGTSLAVLNELYKYINEGVYMVNFVHINIYKNLTAELYTMMVMIYALWMWRRRSTRKRMRRTRKSHLSYYKYKLRGKVLRPEVPWSENGAQGLTEPFEVEVGDLVLHVPTARHEKRRQRLHELCQQKKLKVVLWLAMMYQLHREFLPSTKQRSLALAPALATYPSFRKEKSSLECILAFEQVVQQFEEASESSYPNELKSATLIRCCHAKVREYRQLTVTDSTTYADIREAILSHDRASKVWSQETVSYEESDTRSR